MILCCDFTDLGTEDETPDFMEWFSDLSYRHKIFTVENHDTCLFGARVEGLDENVHFLFNSGVEIEGLKFYGVPFYIEGFENDCTLRIPKVTDVLISHQPPYGILDKAYESGYADVWFGSESLLTGISEISSKFCIFRRVRPMYGTTVQNGTIFVNDTLMNSNGILRKSVIINRILII